MVFRCPCLRLLLAIALALQAGPAMAESVYWNYGIGAIQTGWSDQHNGPIGLKTHIVGIGPHNASSRLQNCIREATQAAGITTQKPLDRRIEDKSMVFERLAAGDTTPTKALLDAAVKEQTDMTAQLMLVVIEVYKEGVERCMAGRAYDAAAVRLGLVTRVCASWFETEQPCMRPRDPVTRKQDPGTGRFAKLQEWLAARNEQRPVNEMIQLMPNGGTAVDISPDLRDRTYFPALTSEQAEFYFEAGVDRLRRNDWKYDYTAPKASGIDQSIAIALIDVVASPVFSMAELRNEGGRLKSASSEIIRNRIRECAFFRGLDHYNSIAQCAGVANEVDVIRNCLGGEECQPDLGNEIRALALTINTVDGDLALSSPLPRILLDNMPASQQFAAARACAERSETGAEFGLCLTESQLLDDRSKQALQCARLTSRTRKIDCMLSAIGGEDAEKARCLIRADGNADRVLCLVSEDTPEEVAEALECASKPGASYESIGSCMLSMNIPGEAGRLANCAGSAGGNAMGAAICVAGNGLSPEQRILLQCAAQSADPSSYGVCVGGQLALKEFANCQDKNFAEGSCFGENNEIRKFIRNIGLGDISEESVVAKMINGPLDLVKYNVRVAEGLAEGIGKFGEETVKFFDDIVNGRFTLPEINACDHLPAGELRDRCEQPFGFIDFPDISFITAPDGALSEMTGTAISEIDASEIRLTVSAQGSVSLGDGEHFVNIGREGNSLSLDTLEELSETLEDDSSWEEIQSSSANGQSRSFVYKGATTLSASGGLVARALEMDRADMRIIDSMKLEDLDISSTIIEQIRDEQMQSQ